MEPKDKNMSEERKKVFGESLEELKATIDNFKNAQSFASLAGASISPEDTEALRDEAKKLMEIALGKKWEDITPEELEINLDNIELEPNRPPPQSKI